MKCLIVVLVCFLVAAQCVPIEEREAATDKENYKVLVKDLTKPSVAKGKKLMWDVVKVVQIYLCSVGADDCEALKEYLQEEDMEEQNLKDQETKDGLIDDADKIMKETHENFMMMDSIRDVLAELICRNEPQQCPFWRFDS